MTKRILVLDLGTRCGWAIGDGVAAPEFGAWDCSIKKGEHRAMRWETFHRFLVNWLPLDGVTAIAYEDVRRHAGTIAAHVYGGLLAHVECLSFELDLPMVPLGVGTIKKHATGKGNASKGEMVAAANERWGLSLDPDKQHDEADALWILDLALKGGGNV